MRSEYIEKIRKMAEFDFAKHRAVLTKAGGMEVLDWRNIESSHYAMRVVFDTLGERIYITGDLGDAIFHCTWKPTLENIACIRDIDYFASKITTSTDYFCFNEDILAEELAEEFESVKPLAEDFESEEEYIQAKEEFKELFYATKDSFYYREGYCHAENEMSYLFDDYFESVSDISNCGKVLAPRVILWKTGIEMAYKQIVADKDCKDK